jgi:hypothetical protein
MVVGAGGQSITGGPAPNTFEHMPCTRHALERSVTKLVKDNMAVPEFRAGYDNWRGACGGVYTITVAQALDVAQYTFSKGIGCGEEEEPAPPRKSGN